MRALLFAALTGILTTASLASAAPEEPANLGPSTQILVKGLLRDGLAELREDNLEGARRAFERAYALDPLPTVALSLAEVEMKLSLYQDAAEHWLAFLKHATPDNPERPAAHDQLAECRRHLGRANIVVNAAAADVLVDDRIVGRAPLRDELWLAPGEHTFSIRSTRGEAPPQKATIALGELKTVEFKLEQPAMRPPASTTPSPSPASSSPASPIPANTDTTRDSGSSTRTAVLITGGALTAVAVGAGIFFTFSANGATADIDDLQTETETEGDQTLVSTSSQCSPSAPMRPPACDELAQRIDDHGTAQTLAIGSFIGAGVFGAATLMTFVFWPSEREEAARLSVAPWSPPGGNGVQARLTF